MNAQLILIWITMIEDFNLQWLNLNWVLGHVSFGDLLNASLENSDVINWLRGVNDFVKTNETRKLG